MSSLASSIAPSLADNFSHLVPRILFVSLTRTCSVSLLPCSIFIRSLRRSATGLINTTRAFLPLLRSRKAGNIINISLLAGRKGTGGGGLYCASKFAVEGRSRRALIRSTASELTPVPSSQASPSLSLLRQKNLGIRVVAIELGTFR